MTEQTPEPTLADVMAAIAALSTKVDRVEANTGQMRTEMNVRFDLADAKTDALDAKVDRVQADVAQVRADVLAVKVEHGFYERHQMSLQTALGQHMQDPDGHPHAA